MNQTNVFIYIISQIVNAFSQMASFQVLPGVSILSLSIFLLTLHTVFDLFWFNIGHEYKAEVSDLRRERINKAKSNKKS